MAEAKRDFSRALLRDFEIERTPMADTWEIKFMDRVTGHWGYLLAAYPREVRRFKSIDAAVSAAEQIGFKVMILKGQ